MHAFDVIGDPVRRRILERLAEGERSSGAIVADIQAEFGISQAAVSQHLKVLKGARLVRDDAQGTRRIYSIDPAGLGAIRAWLDRFWDQALTAYAAAAEREDENEG